MKRLLLTVLIPFLITSGCYGCSFIKEKLGIQVIPHSEEQNQDQQQEENRKEQSVNQQHS